MKIAVAQLIFRCRVGQLFAHMSTITPESSANTTFQLIRNDWPLQLLRTVHIAPSQGLGVIRRALFFSLFCWLPIAIWAFLQNRLLNDSTGEPLLAHFGIHVRCLVAIPLLILAEAPASAGISRILQQFLRTGLVPQSRLQDFQAAIVKVSKLRDATLPWLVVLALSSAWLAGSPTDMYAHELSWASTNGQLGFGGWWFKYVARTVFIFLVMGWIWRLLLLTWLFLKIARLDLSLVATHPDHMGGLGFLQAIPKAFSLVTLALAAVLASRWAHDSIYHQVSLAEFKMPLAVFVLTWSFLLLLPALVFGPSMIAFKRRALGDYRALTAMHGRLVHEKWIMPPSSSSSPPSQSFERETRRVDQSPHPMLEAPELGAMADVATIYQSVEHMRALPIGKVALLGIVLPMVLPMLLVAMTQFPLKDILMSLIKTLM